MNVDLVRLNNHIDKSIPISFEYSFKKEELDGTDIIRLDDVKVEGTMFKNSLDDIEISLNVEGVMILPCALTLKEVEYPFSIEISGSLEENMENLKENYKNFQNTIDILPIIWENILMEIPMRVVSPDIKEDDILKSGDGWAFITEEEDKKSPLSELMDLIDE